MAERNWIPYEELTVEQKALVDSINEVMRGSAANRGWGLDKLINDESWFARRNVARQGYGLDKLINDESSGVRAEVAYQGYGLDILVNDPEWAVRLAVAEQGYGLDKLINDQDRNVRANVKEYLTDHNLTIEEWIAANPEKCGLEENRSKDAAAKGEQQANGPRAMTPPGADKPAHAEKATVGKDASNMKAAPQKAGYEVGARKQGRGL